MNNLARLLFLAQFVSWTKTEIKLNYGKPVLAILLLAALTSCNKESSTKSDQKTQRLIPVDNFNKPHDTHEGIVYFSHDNGESWKNKSNGLPDDIFLTDIAVSNDLLGVTTKQKGIFLFDLQKDSWEGITTNPQTSENVDALYFHQNNIFAGTQNGGIFFSADKGQTWASLNDGLTNFTIRRFNVIQNKLYVGTNGGLYSLNEQEDKWILEYGHRSLQVNGILEFDGEIYIGTNEGVFKTTLHQNEWKNVLPGRSLHNISSAGKIVYALTYNELFASDDRGKTWYSDQKGMPVGKYSFQILQKDNTVLAGQWDGIYKKGGIENWTLANKGLPNNAAILEMKIYKDFIIAASSQWTKN